MSIHRHIVSALLLTAAFSGTAVVAASAQEASAVADRLKQLLVMQGLELSWSGIQGATPSFSLEGVKVKPAGPNGQPIEIGKLTFDGVSEEAGVITVDSVNTDPYSVVEGKNTIDIGALTVTGLRLPAEGATDPMANILFYEGAELPIFSVKTDGKPVFTLEGLTVEISAPADGKPMEFTGAAEKFTADLSQAEDKQMADTAAALGYSTITGFFETAGSWNPADGRMGFTQYDISVENAGTFGMTVDLGGYTPEFIKSMQDMQKQMAEAPAGADNSAQGMAMLGLLQQLTFHSASMRWDDDSLTGKVIEYVAKQQNMKPEDIKNQAKAIVPFLTGQLNNPELSNQITTAVNTYLDDPKSIEINAAPAAPVPFAQIMGSAMSNPLDLTKALGLTVSANADDDAE